MGLTKIEWSDLVFNPWWGCEKVSPACAHCYAEGDAHRWFPGESYWGADHTFRFFGDKHWSEPLKWARTLPAKLGRRPRVFCASMADVFEERRELNAARHRLFNLIEDTPELDWLVLTKRPESARDWLRFERDSLAVHRYGPIPNLWLGVSIENARFTWRADVLREIPAAVRFISAEPLLASLYPGPHTGTNPRRAAPVGQSRTSGSSGQGAHGPNVGRGSEEGSPAYEEDPATMVERRSRSSAPLDLTGIDWIIVGGESGPKARPFHLEHAREIVRVAHLRDAIDKKAVAPYRTAVFVKQLGAKPVCEHVRVGGVDGPGVVLDLRDRKGGDWDEWPLDLRIREFPRSAA